MKETMINTPQMPTTPETPKGMNGDLGRRHSPSLNDYPSKLIKVICYSIIALIVISAISVIMQSHTQ